jgi:FMN phosphatase YigB (HAD superfamily)
MLKAVLLDLDNTLILFDELKYYKAYFKKLNSFFSDDFTPAELRERVINGTMALRFNNGEKTNRQCFLEVFARGREAESASLWDRFMAFYREAYGDIEVTVDLPDGLHPVMDRLRETGLKLAIASNPIFPVIAQEKRVRWGSLDPAGFDLFTHIENMRYVKPMVEYYHQTCELIGEAPAECLMVGNDPVNDMAAALAGLKTYRTTDAEVIDYASLTITEEQRKKSPREIPAPDYAGPFAGVADVVERLMAEKP